MAVEVDTRYTLKRNSFPPACAAGAACGFAKPQAAPAAQAGGKA